MWLTWSLICTKQRPLKGSVRDWFQVNKKDEKYFFTPLALNYRSLTAQTVVWIQRALAGSVNGQCICGIWAGVTEDWSRLYLLWMLGDCKGNAPHNRAWSQTFYTHSLLEPQLGADFSALSSRARLMGWCFDSSPQLCPTTINLETWGLSSVFKFISDAKKSVHTCSIDSIS